MRTLLGILTAILFLSLIGLPIPLAAAEGTAPLFTPEFFKNQTQAGLAEVDDDRLVRNLTDLYGKFRTLNYPNCFACSLWLIRESAEMPSSKQLIMAEYAVRFSPDLPEAHLNRFSSVLNNRPGDIALLFSSFLKFAETSLRTPSRDAFLGALCRVVIFFTGSLFIVLVLAMGMRYGRSLAHLYSHVGSFSLFHMVIGIVILLSGMFLAAKKVIGLELFFILWMFFCYRIMKYRELATLMLLFLSYLTASVSLDLLASVAPAGRPEAAALYRTVYDPPFADRLTVDNGMPETIFARGIQSLYDGRFERADTLFASYAQQIRDPRRIALVMNLRGICAGERGDREGSRKLFIEASKIDERPEYLFNMSRALYAEGSIKDAEQVEMRAIALAGRKSFNYPVLVLPRPYDFYRAVSAPSSSAGFFSDPLVRRAIATILLLLISAFLWGLGAARIAISRCVECGDIICEECGGSDDEVCLTCRVIKAGKNLIGSEEQRAHALRREQWSARRRIVSISMAFVMPGTGMIYNDHIVEGVFYTAASLFLAILFLLPYLFSYVALMGSFPALLKLIGVAFIVLLWLLSMFRTWRVAHNE
ncbi:MAG TPA: hypothetical protein PLV42_12200 [bacterium]|nr:hypothetical protein [bacterium]